MTSFSNYFEAGANSTLRIKKGTNWSHKGQWVQVFTDTEIDRWYVGDFSTASYQITVEFDSNKKEIIHALVVARPDEASIVLYGRASIDDELITLTATVNNSYLSLKASARIPEFNGVRVIYIATYAETMGPLTIAAPRTFLVPPDEGEIFVATVTLPELLDVTIEEPLQNQALLFNGVNWVNSEVVIANTAFSTIAVTGQPSVVSENEADTVTLTAGSGISLTTNGKTITVAAATQNFATTTYVDNKFVTINNFIDVDTVTTPPSVGFVLKWNGSRWVPAADLGSAGGGGGGGDADTLDGFDSTYYLNYNNLLFAPDLSIYATVDNAQFVGTATLTDGVLITPGISTGSESAEGTFTGRWLLTGSSRLTATFADLAENYVADADYEPGTVVMFGGEHEITVASEDTPRVAGVVSDRFAYLMNGGCEGDHVSSIALQGRVHVKVKGAVKKGDMMISAGNGYAKSSDDPRMGQVIGKSLADFDGDSGMVEVVVGRM